MIPNTSDMWLVYVADDGEHHHLHWRDVDDTGTPIDAETGDDMELIGWTTVKP